MERILVTGATGFIGQNLVTKLRQEGVSVVGYDRILTKTDYLLIEGNFADETRFEQILRDNQIDTVYHLISTTVPKEDTSDIDVEVMDNVVPTLRLLEAMRRAGTKRMIFVSSGGTVYGEGKNAAHRITDSTEPICGYGMQKLVIEEYLQFYNRRYEMDLRIVRLANPYGVLPHRFRVQGIIPIFMERLLKGEPITVFGDTLRDYIDIDDAVAALVKLGAYEGSKKLFNVGSGVPTRVSEIVALIEKTAGKKFVSVEHKPIRTCDVQENVLDISETKQELQWTPKINLEEGILRTWRAVEALHR